MVMQVRRTVSIGAVPTGLAEGQLSVGMADQPPIAWVGVPASVNPAGVIPITGLVRTVAGAPQPAGALGQLWWDEDAAQLFVYTGSEWVVAVNPPIPDLSGFATQDWVNAQLGKPTYVGATPPSNPDNGDLWLDTSVTPPVLKVWNAGTSVWDLSTGAIDGFLPLTGGVLSGPGDLLVSGTLGVQGQINVYSDGVRFNRYGADYLAWARDPYGLQFFLNDTNESQYEYNLLSGCYTMRLNGDATITTYWTGGVTLTTPPGTWSDRRLKSNIAPAGDALAALNRLPVHSADFTPPVPNPERQHFDYTLLADEVAQALPSAHLPERDGYAGVRELPLIAALIKAVQQLTDRIKALEAT